MEKTLKSYFKWFHKRIKISKDIKNFNIEEFDNNIYLLENYLENLEQGNVILSKALNKVIESLNSEKRLIEEKIENTENFIRAANMSVKENRKYFEMVSIENYKILILERIIEELKTEQKANYDLVKSRKE